METKLWILEPIPKGVDPHDPMMDPWGNGRNFDTAYGFVVRAFSAHDARRYAAEACGEEGKNAWISPRLSTCKILKAAGEVGVVMRNFRSG